MAENENPEVTDDKTRARQNPFDPPPYEHVADPEFALELQKAVWDKKPEWGGIVLQKPCPICNHVDGIDVFVPTEVAKIAADADVTDERVECACTGNHGQPTGKAGCGRWGLVRPHAE